MNNIFIDTNIFERYNFNVSNNYFLFLKKYLQIDENILLVNSIIIQEIKSHINDKIREAVTKINNGLSSPIFRVLGSPSIFDFDKLNANSLVDEAIKVFEQYLTDCGAIEIDINNIDITSIFEDYFKKNAPFESKKPNEFKDAFMIAALKKYMYSESSDDVYYIISNDKGFCEAFDAPIFDSNGRKINVKVFNHLNDFFNELVDKDKLTYLDICLHDEIRLNLVHEQIRKCLHIADYNIVDSCNEITDYWLNGIENMQFKCQYYNEHSDNMTFICIRCNATISLGYRYRDEDQSCWDREEQRYLFEHYVDKEATFDVEFDMDQCVNISKCYWLNGTANNDSCANIEDQSITVLSGTLLDDFKLDVEDASNIRVIYRDF